MGRRRTAVVLIVAALIGLAVALTPPVGASTGVEDQLRAEIARFLNYERTNRGLSLLPIDTDLQHSAQAWSERNRSVECGPSAPCHSPDAQAEILAWGGPDSRSGGIVEAWMRSSTHRNILLHPSASALGVGFACTEDGWVYATVHFYGVHRPVPATEENPKYTRIGQGSACQLPAAYAEDNAPPTSAPAATTTTSTTPSPPVTHAPPTTRPRPTTSAVATTIAAPLVIDRPATTTTVVAPTTSTTSEIRVGLRAHAPRITATDLTPEALAFEESTARPAGTEPAWVAMVVVVVLLYAMRVGAQLREAAAARRSENGRPGVGL